MTLDNLPELIGLQVPVLTETRSRGEVDPPPIGDVLDDDLLGDGVNVECLIDRAGEVLARVERIADSRSTASSKVV